MIIRPFICLVLTTFYLVNFARSAAVEDIYASLLGKISQNGPRHVYLTETEEYAGQIDDWAGWMRLEDYAHRLGLDAFKTSSISSTANDVKYSHPEFLAVLNDFRNVLRATKACKDMRFEGDIRESEAYIAFEWLPATSSWDGVNIVEHKLEVTQYAFGWKQENKGRSYIASPVALRGVVEGKHVTINLEGEDVAVSAMAAGMRALTIGMDERKKQEIFDRYKVVSEKFLGREKRKFIGSAVHILLIDFTREYITRRPSIIDITDLSSRAVIYLLTEITNFKLLYKSGASCWKKERKTRDGNSYDEWVDQLPTTFQIGDYTYKLENAATANKPGGGRLYGLTEADTADTYEQILRWLQTRQGNLEKFKGALLKRQQGTKISFQYGEGENKGKEAVPINKFLNGLSLLLNFEVARRLVEGDRFKELPVIAVMPYVLEHFNNLAIFKRCYSCIFGGDAREEWTKTTVIRAREDLDTQRKIRASLKVFHKDTEDSGDEGGYSDDERKADA